MADTNNPNLMTSERDWMIAHERELSDPRTAQDLEIAYNDAMARGLRRGTPEYFDHLERATGMQGGSDGTFRMKLEPETRQLIQNLGITELEYVRQQRRLQQMRRDDPERYPSV